MKIEGLPVKDGSKSIMIVITTGDIKKSKIKSPSECAAAVACRRMLGATEARVHLGRTYLRYNNHWERYLTSKPLRSEVVAFDRGGTFMPGEYLLDKMQPSRKNDPSRDKRNKPRGKKRAQYHLTLGVRPMGRK
jgi:hypothetical protein